MIPKQAIEKAIEGGWNTYKGEPIEFYYYDECRPKFQEIALDPSFWQSLGKALGWKETYSRGYSEDATGHFVGEMEVNGTIYVGSISAWEYHALRFYDLILTGGDTEKFWRDILV